MRRGARFGSPLVAPVFSVMTRFACVRNALAGAVLVYVADPAQAGGARRSACRTRGGGSHDRPQPCCRSGHGGSGPCPEPSAAQ